MVRCLSQGQNQGCKPEPLAISKASKLAGNITFCRPILTNVSKRDCMAIIKIDKTAVSHLRRLAENERNSDSDHGRDMNVPVNFTMAATDPFVIALDHVTKIKVIFKLFLDGCVHEEREKFVSVFVELSDPEGNHLKTPFLMTLFLKNLKDENGNSFKKCIKLNPSSSSRVERGVRDFVAVKDFDTLLESESIVSFGVLVKQQVVEEVSS